MKAASSIVSLLFSSALLAALPFGLTACGIGESGDDSVQAKIQRDNEKLAATYGTITGTYAGTLVTGGTQQGLPAELQVYIVNVQDGVDPNNAPKSRLALRAQLKLLGVGELDDTNFNADFNEFDGRISLEQPTAAPAGGAGAGQNPIGTMNDCPVGPRDARLSVNGHILNGELSDGLVSGTNGLVGTLNLKRTTSENKQPLRDQPERLRRAYARILGTYEGPFTSQVVNPVTRKPEMKDANSQVIVRVVEQPTVGGNTCPTLVGQFRFTDVVRKIDDSSFSVSFRESTNEIFFTPAASGNARVCPVGPKDAQLAIDGRVEGKKLNGALKGTGGVLGDLKLSWKNANTIAPDDQAERLERAYSSVVGIYGGRFDDMNGSGNKDFPVKLSVSLTTELIGGVNCPALQGQYIRPDIGEDIGVISLLADYYPFEDNITLRNSEGDTPGGVAGNKRITIVGIYQTEDRSRISGNMQWWGRSGSISLKKCRGGEVDNKGNCR